MQVVLSQAIIPVNMVVAFTWLGTRFRATHLLGVLFVFGGVVVSTVDSMTSQKTAWYWLAILCLKAVPMALSNVYKEKGLKQYNLDVWYVVASNFKFTTYYACVLTGTRCNLCYV